jgi:hypothetical protein
MSLLRQDVRLPESSIHDFGRDMVVALQVRQCAADGCAGFVEGSWVMTGSMAWWRGALSMGCMRYAGLVAGQLHGGGAAGGRQVAWCAADREIASCSLGWLCWVEGIQLGYRRKQTWPSRVRKHGSREIIKARRRSRAEIRG